MATAVQKITLASSRDIPFNQLVLSQSNVRRVKAGVSVDEMAESIARRGLIQGLHVRPVLGEDGAETGTYEVPAGGRRYRALELLVKQKRLAKAAPVPCIVSAADDAVLIDEVSLAENIERAPLHPLDQYRAFHALREKGMTEEAIAAAFFVDVKVVKQRLRLVTVSPALLEVYGEDGMTLEQLMAFTISGDHARQEQVWAAVKDSWSKEPYQIRRMLTETTVRASDKRARFVGIEAYEAAGGYVLRDLFQQDDGGWLKDLALLERLVAEKLRSEAEAIAAEGWKWIEVAVNFPYGHNFGLRALLGTTVDLTDEERATREALRDEFDRLEAEYAEAVDLPDEVDQRLGEIEQLLEDFDSRPMAFDPEQVGRAGAFISLDANGTLLVERGFVRPEDEPSTAPIGDEIEGAAGNAEQRAADQDGGQRTVISMGGEARPPEDEEAEGDTIKPLPERLVIELTAHRTLALRDAVANNPRIAMTALLHKLAGAGTVIPREARKFLLCCQAPKGVRQRSPPGCRSPSRPQGRGPETAKRRKNMATIGTFKKTGNDYTGEIFTLSLQAKGARLVPSSSASGENAPSHRVLVGRPEIGAAWTKTSNEGRAYLGLKLDDPSFAAPIYANLFDDEDGEGSSLIWSRPNNSRRGD